MNTDISKGRNAYSVYEGDENNFYGSDPKFGYCKPDRKWYLFTGNTTSACDADALDQLAYSERTFDFDISVSFDGSWVRCTYCNKIQKNMVLFSPPFWLGFQFF
jgi:hypothetical protein